MPLIIAHRGASRDFAENTVDAFRGAIAQGADWVELDVRRTADGALVVHHDALVAGSDRPLAELRAVDLPSVVPMLADALAACEHLGVNVEIKNTDGEPGFDPSRRLADEVVAVIDAMGRPRRAPVLVSSFDVRTIDRVHEVAPGIPTGLLTVGLRPDRVDRVVALTAERGHVALHPDEASVDRELVDRAHAAGLAVHVWTVDDAERLRALSALGVDGLITNVPAEARAALRG